MASKKLLNIIRIKHIFTGLINSPYKFDAILLLLLIILSSILIFNNLGESSLFADEATYARAERDAAEKNYWMPLHMGEEPFLYKPPLKIWAVALIFKYFGINEFNARILDALFGVATIALIFIFGRIFFNRKIGFIAALLLLTADKYISLYDSVFFFANGVRASVMESWFVFFISAGLLLYLYYFDNKQTNKKLLYIIGILTGAALLTKGVIAFMVITIICVFKFVLNRKKKFLLSAYYDTFLISIIALIFYLPWFFLMNFSTNWNYFYYMYDDLFVRAITGLDSYHIHGLFFYISSIVLDFRIWLIFLLLVPFIIGSKNQIGIHKYYFLLTWVLIIFIGFSIPISKLVWYVYPLYPALALLLAYNIDISFAFFKKVGHFYKLIFIGFITIFLLIGLIFAFLNSEDIRIIGVHKFVKIYQQQKNPQLFIDPALNYSTLLRKDWTDFYLDQIINKTEGIPKINKKACVFLLTENKSMIQKYPAHSQIKLDFFAINKSEAYILNFCMNKSDKS